MVRKSKKKNEKNVLTYRGRNGHIVQFKSAVFGSRNEKSCSCGEGQGCDGSCVRVHELHTIPIYNNVKRFERKYNE
jgi:hypothetical protein